MKRIKAYLVINTRIKDESPDKVAGVFWKKSNAKNFAWQLNTESADAKSGELFTVEKYWFVPNRSANFSNIHSNIQETFS
ncbi:MAG TPA: hypothetical protein VGI61_04420 [Parafilimonas sp.]|jgi:hypothetical protein